MTLGPVDYDHRQHLHYARARSLPEPVRAMWLSAFAAHAPARRPITVLDLGCGSGRFTPALAEAFGKAIGVEPSIRMREIAEQTNAHPDVSYFEGRAEAIPAPSASADLVLMMLSYHHVRDRAAAAREIARVLAPDGRLLVRSVFSDRMPVIDWHRFFPSADAIERAMFPTTTATREAFAAAGLELVALERHRELMAESWADMASRLALRSLSTFEHMDEAETRAGLAALAEHAAARPQSEPLYIEADLMVFAAR